jgi:hypothetical protein
VGQEQQQSHLKPEEQAAFAKMKSFCAGILKTLAPPLLREIESSKLLPEAEPFTLR